MQKKRFQTQIVGVPLGRFGRKGKDKKKSKKGKGEDEGKGEDDASQVGATRVARETKGRPPSLSPLMMSCQPRCVLTCHTLTVKAKII